MANTLTRNSTSIQTIGHQSTTAVRIGERAAKLIIEKTMVHIFAVNKPR